MLEINARYEEILAAGFPTATFAGQPGPERLQYLTDTDRTNWLNVLVIANRQRQTALENGTPLIMNDPYPAPIRCLSNRQYTVTYASALNRMYALLARASAAQANMWRLKDAARTVETREALEAIDLGEGW